MKLLRSLYAINSKSGNEAAIQKFITDWVGTQVPECKVEEDQMHNLYFTKGQSADYPTVVAHMDQVQSYTEIMTIVTEGIIFGYNKTTHTLEGLGADDKNGIWIALNCLLKYPAIKVAFFVKEEIGCVGSNSCDMTFFNDSRFVIQCDRKGNADFVTVAACEQLCNDKFVKDAKIEDFGYKECTSGGLTDVKALRTQGLKVCSCNISCGYYDPHSNHETTDIKDLQNCLSLVEYMIENMTEVYTFPKSEAKTFYGHSSYGSGFSSNWQNWGEEDYWNGAYHKNSYSKGTLTPKIPKVEDKRFQEQCRDAKTALRDYLGDKPSESLIYNFFIENKFLFPNISYYKLVQIYHEILKERRK